MVEMAPMRQQIAIVELDGDFQPMEGDISWALNNSILGRAFNSIVARLPIGLSCMPYFGEVMRQSSALRV